MSHDFATAEARWAGLGPYYAMFPTDFALDIIRRYSQQSDAVLDPFCGRGSSVYAAAVLGRRGCGIEINPVGWLYSTVKLRPGPKADVLNRLEQLGSWASKVRREDVRLPEFFRRCFSPGVLRFLLTARQRLSWKRSRVDASLMALILVYLHGKYKQSLSNQMRQSRAMSPSYSLRWWKEKGMTAPNIDPVEFLQKRIEWRYKKGVPHRSQVRVFLGDSSVLLKRLRPKQKFRLLFTSPPYRGLANYHYDQWLRLWMLGGPPSPRRCWGKYQAKFESRSEYEHLLTTVFKTAAPNVARDAVIYVRTDARDFTYGCTRNVLTAVFSGKNLTEIERPFQKPTQTALFGDKQKKPGEIDLVLS